VTEFPAGLNAGSHPVGITAGPDGNLWFTDSGTIGAIGRITPSDTVTEFPTGITTGSPEGIAAGPDGNLWFAQGPNWVGRIDLVPITTTTAVTSSADPSAVGKPVTFTAAVSPLPTGGTVSFTDNGSPIAGCVSTLVDPSTGTATCAITPGTTGAHNIVAAFSGTTGYATSTSPILTQVVTSTLCPSLVGCNLSGLNLSDAGLAGADLQGANLSGADLSGTNLNGANLAGANLNGANLVGAKLSGANLADANLNHANLTDADLTCANTTDANFNHANLTGATVGC